MKPSTRGSYLFTAVGLLAALVTAACGSTLPEATQQVASIQGTEDVDASSGLPPGAEINSEGQIVNAQGEVIGTVSGGLATGGDLAGNDPSQLGGGTPGGASVDAGANGPGVTQETIALGLKTFAEIGTVNEALGTQAVGSFDYKRAWQALVKYQNEHGGIAGRRIMPVFWSQDSYSAESWPQQEQRACARWTQDEHVFAALTGLYSTNILQCMHEAGGVVTSLDRRGADAGIKPIQQHFPFYVAPVALAIDRAAEVMVDSLAAMDYFAGDHKLGLVTFDAPSFKYAAEKRLIPALRRRGISLSDAAYLHTPGGVNEYGQVSNDATNAVLRFKSQGVDQVVFIDWGTLGAWQFMLAAERQDYHPRYGLTSASGNQALAVLLGNDAGSQLRGSVSIGWIPHLDTREADDPYRKSPTRVLCLSIMRKAGINTASVNGQDGALSICDALWSLAAALDGASVVNQSTYLAGMNGLRGRYSPGAVWSAYVGPGQHDGVSAVANLRFVDKCTCFKYSSDPYAIR